MRSHEVCDDLTEGAQDKLRSVDFIVFYEPDDESAHGLDFEMLKRNWAKKHSVFSWENQPGAVGKDRWTSYKKEWNTFLNEFTYYGLITKNHGYNTYLYVHKEDAKQSTGNKPDKNMEDK
jgi:hypothetical protein